MYHPTMENVPRSLPGWLAVLLTIASYGHAQRYVEREVMIPWVLAGSGLDAMLVYAELPGKHPLVVITHGTSRKPEEHALVTPWQQLPQALWFARRGWIALVVVRRGYGVSGGEPDVRLAGRCPQTDYQTAAEYSAEDLRVRSTMRAGYPRWMPRTLSPWGFPPEDLQPSPSPRRRQLAWWQPSTLPEDEVRRRIIMCATRAI